MQREFFSTAYPFVRDVEYERSKKRRHAAGFSAPCRYRYSASSQTDHVTSPLLNQPLLLGNINLFICCAICCGWSSDSIGLRYP